MADKKDIEKLVAKMSAAFPNWQVNAFTIQVYYEDLRDLDGEELAIAGDHCRTEAGRKFAPSTGELRGAVYDIRRMSSNIPDSYAAWAAVIGKIQDRRIDESAWNHPLVQQAVKYMGERNLRMSEDQTSDRSRFIACYEQLVERATKENMLLPAVRGYIEERGAKLIDSGVKQLTDRLAEK
jgi:hypothetical protein